MSNKQKEFNDLVKPLIEWLASNCQPHVTVIVTPSDAELLEGKLCINNSETK